MFDPTVFENLKVGIENIVYDLDNLDKKVLVTGRSDLLNMAVMSRSFVLQFELTGQHETYAEIVLEAGVQDLAAEILEIPDETPGCALKLRFTQTIEDVEAGCPVMAEIVQRIWEPEVQPIQTVGFMYGEKPVRYLSTIEIGFSRKIHEEQMGDLPKLVDYMLQTLAALNEAAARKS
ncbi:hypothetical protein [Paenibacillus campinasensis]|uniref:Uncharacterized protein n=1 Tax=Paenibacillus campinasensis TaxID=66347 RepID=A0A268EX01_9BACL|nr:hypothetical protein [Paenibacillus campinasensis]PAD77652.1 hypothetical protein CHH67_09315 [Paenibacillus campinasensis]